MSMAGSIDMLEGGWTPLYKVLNALVIFPFNPLIQDGHQKPLQIGDHVYCFEVFHGHLGAASTWYRGYVVKQHPFVSMQSQSRASEDNVSVGIFPAAHLHIKEEVNFPGVQGFLESKPMDSPELSQMARRMDPLQEEDEDMNSPPLLGSPKFSNSNGHLDSRSFNPCNASPPENTSSTWSSPELYISKSSNVQSRSPSASLNGTSHSATKSIPPFLAPANVDTSTSNHAEPLIDETAAAIREWSELLFKHLDGCDYMLFGKVKRLIDLTHAGRRQLLSGQLSTEELQSTRTELVALLAKGNALQGLGVIVRHSKTGATIDSTQSNNMSGLELFSNTISMAYSSSTPNISKVGGNTQHQLFPLRDGKTSGSRDSTEPLAASSHLNHLLLDVKAFVANPCLSDETCELYFSIFNKTQMRFLSEDFCIIVNANGTPLDPARIGKLTALFRDLTDNDVGDDLFLVCRIVKNGRLKSLPTQSSTSSLALSPSMSNSSDHASQQPQSLTAPSSMLRTASNGTETVRRPFGCAVLSLSSIFAGSDETSIPHNRHGELQMPIFVPISEAIFSTLHEDIILSRTKEFEKSPKATCVTISLTAMHGKFNIVMRQHANQLQHAAVTNRLTFPDVIEPEEVTRNDLYIKLWSGDFSQASSSGGNFGSIRSIRGLQPMASGGSANSHGKSIEVAVQVRSDDGSSIPACIGRGSGEPYTSLFQSVVYKANATPTFGELFKIDIAPSLMATSHLFFTFRDRSSKVKSLAQIDADKPFAFAYLPLFRSENAFLSDGAHSLALFRYTSDAIHPSVYLTPANSHGKKGISPLQPLRDSIVIRSFLCSTYYTQNPVLLRILRWETALADDPAVFRDVLSKLKYCNEAELVSQCRHILDALFRIVASGADGKGDYDEICFESIVALLGIISDRRFKNFSSVLQTYIEHYFAFTCYLPILKNFEQLLAQSSKSTEASQILRATIKVWVPLFQLVVKARQNQRLRGIGSDVTEDHLEAAFRREIRNVFVQINSIMSQTQPAAIIGTQVLMMQHFAEVIDVLSTTFASNDLLALIEDFCENIAHYTGKMAVHKLSLLADLSKLSLFTSAQTRAAFVPSALRWLKPHLGRYEEDILLSSTKEEGHSAATVRHKARLQWVESARLAVSIVASLTQRSYDGVESSHAQSRNQVPDANQRKDDQVASHEEDCTDFLLGITPALVITFHEFASLKASDMQYPNTSQSFSPTIPAVFPLAMPFEVFYGSINAAPLPKDVANHIPSKSNAVLLGEIAAVIFTIQQCVTDDRSYESLINHLDIEGAENFQRLTISILTFMDTVLSSCLAENWINFNLFCLKTTLKMLRVIATILRERFIPVAQRSYDFNFGLWRAFFSTLFRIIDHKVLKIQQNQYQARRVVSVLAGDIRSETAVILSKTWKCLGWPDTTLFRDKSANVGGYQVQLSSLVLNPVLSLCLSPKDDLRAVSVEILFTILVGEHRINRDFSQIQSQMIDVLDKLFSDHLADNMTRFTFVTQLRSYSSPSLRDDALRQKLESLLTSLATFLDLLTSVRDLPTGNEFLDDRVIGTLRLMKYIKEISSSTIFCRYVHRLKDFHIQNQTFVEAGLVLKLHADLYTWSQATIAEALPELGLPQQSNFHRKETLYTQIINLLDAGKAYETALILLKELQEQYEVHSFAYAKLADVMARQAEFYRNIITEERHFPNCFRVKHLGSAFPQFVRDKEFVYRGLGQEKLSAFIQRMGARHSSASLLQMHELIPQEAMDGQYLQINQVSPEPDRQFAVFTNPDVDKAIRIYYEHNGTNLFSYETFVQKPVPDFLNVSDLPALYLNKWTIKTTLVCADAFPTVLQRTEVLETHVTEMSPLDKAIGDLHKTTRQLEALEGRFTTVEDKQADITPLSMALNAQVDTMPTEGLGLYRRAFMTREYTIAFSEHSSQIQQLRLAIDRLAEIIADCLCTHARLCPTDMHDFHRTLCDFYQKNFSAEISRQSIDITRFIPNRASAATTQTSDVPNYLGPQVNGYAESSKDSIGGTTNGVRYSIQLMPGHLEAPLFNGSPSGKGDLLPCDVSLDSASVVSSQRTKRPASILSSKFGSIRFKRKESGGV